MTDAANINWLFSSYNDAQGRTYIISFYNKWDPQKQQSRVAKRVHVGRLNADTGEVYLGKTYLKNHPEYEGKTVFYEDNALVERSKEQVDEIKKEASNDLSFRCDCVSFGLTYACHELASNSNMLSALREVFGEDGDELLRLGIYQFCSQNQALQNYDDWLAMNYLPKAKPLSSNQISKLLSKVTQEDIDKYFALRFKHILDRHNQKNTVGDYVPPMMMAIDSTSISTYSKTIKDAAYGHAKQDDFLKQVNLTLCVDYDTGDICYAYQSEGSINDMSLFPDLLMRMQNNNFDLSNVLLTTDRGYSSVMNIQKQINCKLKFLTGVRLSEDSVKKSIDRYKASLTAPSFLSGKLGVYARTAPIERWTSTTDGINIDYDVYLHLYRDGALAESQNAAFMTNVQALLESKNKGLKGDSNLWRNYSKFLFQDEKTKKWNINYKAVEMACKYNGYFAIRTNEILDPFDSLIIYRERNIVECAFRQFKVLNGCDRLQATNLTYIGKLFIHLIAQSLRMMMTVKACSHKADGKVLPGDSLNKAMMQLQKLQASKPAGRGVWIVKELPKNTRELFELFDIQTPKKQVKN